MIPAPTVQRSVKLDENIELDLAIVNPTPDLRYQWLRNGRSLFGETLSSLTLLNVQIGQAGTYSVIVSNFARAVTNMAAVIAIAMPIQVQAGLIRDNGLLKCRIVGPLSRGLVVQAATNLLDWVPIYTNSTTAASLDFTDSQSTNLPSRIYRVVPWP